MFKPEPLEQCFLGAWVLYYASTYAGYSAAKGPGVLKGAFDLPCQIRIRYQNEGLWSAVFIVSHRSHLRLRRFLQAKKNAFAHGVPIDPQQGPLTMQVMWP